MKIFENEVSPVDIATEVVKFVTTAGVIYVVHSIIENNAGPAETRIQAIKLWAGTYVIVSLIVSHTSEHVECQIAKALGVIDGIKTEYKKIVEAEK